MGVWRTVVTVLTLTGKAFPFSIQTRAADDVFLSLESQQIGGFNLAVTKDGEKEVIGHIGRTLYGSFTFDNIDSDVSVKMGNVNLTVTPWFEEDSQAYGARIRWSADASTRLEDCIDFGNKHWYGGPMQFEQKYPLEEATQRFAAAVTKEDDHASIAERYWLNSAGEYYYVHPEVSLFVDHGNILNNHICFAAQIAPPYSSSKTHNNLVYDIWFHDNVKAAHEDAVERYLGKPSGLPDFRMVQHPIWSTWAQYSRDIDETKLLDFAYQIVENGFNNSQFEIDDLWETCYGSLTVDEGKFPNFLNLVEEIKSLGFRVAMWVHPFINKNCEPWYSEALSNGYLVLNEEGNPDTTWWNNNGSVPGYIDFTNPQATNWWTNRVRDLINTYDIDSLKFDAGESSWSPQVPVQNGDVDFHPHNIVESYVRACAEFGDMIEIRTGFRTQDLPVFVRMVDRDSVWGLNNGLSTIITTTLEMNLNGYTFVLPDMIGGNGYGTSVDELSSEFFIRWVQANTFLPTMQYSFVPWNFDNETIEICKKYTDLHAVFAKDIYAAMNASVVYGSPVNAPIWWADPTDNETYTIWDEFLVGDYILVAPVLEEGAVTRDIYLPAGIWYPEGDLETPYEGRQWLRNYSAPLEILPYFIEEKYFESESDANIKLGSFVLIILSVVIHLLRC